MLDDFLQQTIILDMRSSFVCIGELTKFDELFLSITDADMHDMRDSETTRENYVVAAAQTGVKRNRRRVLVSRADVVGISLLTDVVDS